MGKNLFSCFRDLVTSNEAHTYWTGNYHCDVSNSNRTLYHCRRESHLIAIDEIVFTIVVFKRFMNIYKHLMYNGPKSYSETGIRCNTFNDAYYRVGLA